MLGIIFQASDTAHWSHSVIRCAILLALSLAQRGFFFGYRFNVIANGWLYFLSPTGWFRDDFKKPIARGVT